ncbi:hypothetical protein SYNPS1DRAFT_31101 [Syncephalis pseudoplumigaleata]|uniref:Uncharacterized protein n=1 Tax=Syncephalis pseudoplumigaleata TaxID=1712513 RepID=A0A4P9YTE8_9FUNG|nr:hypothetical protein SYNPS1DRAFT_31101 [Syncephalis pseudoplumigaleata]|eukprot:RKP23187.1 hypothetical protein SYNPS1DRAFT_31101 [Syncephalis pseudoplumigaleata]
MHIDIHPDIAPLLLLLLFPLGHSTHRSRLTLLLLVSPICFHRAAAAAAATRAITKLPVVMSTTPVTLGWVTVQSDFADVLAELQQGKTSAESVWISCYNKGMDGSVHETIVLERAGKDANNVDIKAEGQRQIDVRVDACEISAIDISPGEALFVVGGDMPSSSQPQLGVGYMNPLGEQRTKLEGHKATVTSLQFFPSGQGITSTAIVARGRNVA